MYTIFGANPVPFHIVALLVHIANTCLVACIINKIIPDLQILGHIPALVYGSAVAIHLDPLGWVAGFYDVGGAFFFFISLLLYTNQKTVLSAILYFVGCHFKESVIVLPIILFSYSLIINRKIGLKYTFLIRWKHSVPFLLVLGIVTMIKLSAASPIHFPDSHPYIIDFTGIHVIRNLLVYPAWMFQSFFPFLSARHLLYQIMVVGVAIIMSYGITLAMSQEKATKNLSRRILFLIVWLLVGLLPVIFLPNHVYRYYGTYSLPAFIGILLLILKSILLHYKVSDKCTITILIVLCLFGIISSIIQSNHLYRESIDQNTLSKNTNMLIRRATYVNIVKDGLMRLLPNPPKNSILVIGDVDIWAFDKNSGPQFWYEDNTISVYTLSDLKFKEGVPYLDISFETQVQAYTGPLYKKIYPDSNKLFIFKISNKRLVKLDLQKLKQN
jgi:hypothetical protein